MKENNEKDEYRFDRLYQLLGEEVNNVHEDNTTIPQNEENNSQSTQNFNDIFNIFNHEDNKPNTEAFINAVNKQNNNEYLQELNTLMNNYTQEAKTEAKQSDFDEKLFFNESESIFNPIYWEAESNDENQPEIPITSTEENDTPNEEVVTNDDILETEDNLETNVEQVVIDEPINPSISDEKEASTQSENNPEATDEKEVVAEEIIQSENNSNQEPINEEIFIEPTKIEIENKILKTEKDHNNEYNIDNKTETRNKTLIPSKNIYDDGLDTTDYKKTIMDILSSRKTVHILLVVIFIVVLILVIKSIHIGKLVNIYNEYTTETSKESDESTKIYDDDMVDIETLKKTAANELIECISSPIDTAKLPDELNNIVKEINDYYRSSGNYVAFAYKDLFTGFTVSYNENGNVFAASMVKAPVNIYLYEMASQGKINLDDKLTYTANYYNNGTGVLKNKQVNTSYSIRELSEYAIRNSDNAAHNMLMDKYGRNNIKKFWSDKGTNIILTGNDNWGLINAHDAMIYMKELYTFYINNDEYGNELMNNFLGAKTKFITGKNNYKVANKTGWSGTSQHDAAIVFADNPYIVVALTHLGYNKNYMNHFNAVNELANKLHNEYWKYKLKMCDNIKQHD